MYFSMCKLKRANFEIHSCWFAICLIETPSKTHTHTHAQHHTHTYTIPQQLIILESLSFKIHEITMCLASEKNVASLENNIPHTCHQTLVVPFLFHN